MINYRTVAIGFLATGSAVAGGFPKALHLQTTIQAGPPRPARPGASEANQAYDLLKSGVTAETLSGAMPLLEASAAAGSPMGQRLLGILLMRPGSTESQRAQAVELIRKAALGGDGTAAALYGAMLAEGEGLPRDPLRALAYLRAARNLREKKAEPLIERLESEMRLPATMPSGARLVVDPMLVVGRLPSKATRYPAAWGEENRMGLLILSIQVQTDGKLGEIALQEGDPALAGPVLDAVREATFQPILVDGEARPFRFLLPVSHSVLTMIRTLSIVPSVRR